MSVLPVVAIVGRPNVGKSTLFNQLTRARHALVADEAGLTRDRQYGTVRHPERPFVVVDTGGIRTAARRIEALIGKQAESAMSEADIVVLLLDAREGLTPEDRMIADRVRSLGHRVIPVVNKVDGLDPDVAIADFHALGFGPPLPVAAAHGRGVRALADTLVATLPAAKEEDATQAPGDRVRVAIVGRPNVGKSTLVNRLVGEERMITDDAPGTTRDSIFVPFERGPRRYILIDTAGVRRRPRVHETVEKFSVVKTLQAIEAAHVVVVMLDAVAGLTEQDLRLLGHVLEAGPALVLALNKWDAVSAEGRRAMRSECERRLRFVEYASRLAISAAQGTGLGALMRGVDAAWRAATARLPTPELTRILADAVIQHPPPVVRGRRIKLRYAHQGGTRPPRIVIHGNQTEALPASYERYLIGVFRSAFALEGTPIRLELRSGENPYRGRRNPLSPRQQAKRRRLLRHVKR